MITLGTDAEGRTTVHNGGYVETIGDRMPINRHTDLTRLPRRGSYIVQALHVAGVIVFSGAFVSVCIQIVAMAWRIVTAGRIG